jgi:hypothetical protein
MTMKHDSPLSVRAWLAVCPSTIRDGFETLGWEQSRNPVSIEIRDNGTTSPPLVPE